MKTHPRACLPLALAAFGLVSSAWAAPPAAAPAVNLSHLDFLSERRERPGRSFGREPVAMVWVYAERDPETGTYTRVHAHGAANQGPELEGVACVDDVARAVLVYARELGWRRGQGLPEDPALSRRLAESLRFLLGMEVPGVGMANFVNRSLQRNLHGVTSRAGLDWWAARALRAYAKSEELLDGDLRARVLRARVRGARRRLVSLLGEQVLPRVGRYREIVGPAGLLRSRFPDWLPGGGTDQAAVWLLGLTELGEAAPLDLVTALARGIAESEVLPGLVPSWLGKGPVRTDEITWHGWGSYQAAALARASVLLGEPAYLDLARRILERDHCSFPLTGIPYSVEAAASARPRVKPFPEIAYAQQTAVESAHAVFLVTGEERYRVLAGLLAGWFLGANRRGEPMYDPATGRTFDDLRSTGINRNAGAESCVEGLMVIQRLRADPALADYARHRLVGSYLDAPSSPGAAGRFRNGGRELSWEIGAGGVGARSVPWRREAEGP